MNDHDLFTFGEKLGNGTEENHFQLGFTSKALLGNLDRCSNNKNGMFHFDWTYKILKYSYPLMVFGCSDMNRRFFPIAFMFTSHETISDFDHFFENFNIICSYFNFDFKPKFIVTDADSAMAASIKKMYSLCKIFLCVGFI